MLRLSLNRTTSNPQSTMSNAPESKEKNSDKNTLTLTVGTPKGSFTAEFPKTTKVSEIIEAAISKMGLDGAADAFEVFHGDKELKPIERPLVSFGLKDGDTLLIAAIGSGV